MSNQIPLSQSDLGEREQEAVLDALGGDHLSLGPWTARFEAAVARRVQAQHGIAFNSGSSGLQVVLESLGIAAGDEVITAAFTFHSAAACILHAGATPVFADCDPASLNMDAASVAERIGPRTKAILAPHTLGSPVGIDALATLALGHELPLIEDAGLALGSSLRGRPVGNFGRVAILAFHGASQVTSCEGGMVVTDDDALAHQCRLRRNHGLATDAGLRVDHLHGVRTDELMHALGHGHRLSEIHAAVGAAQVEQLDEIMARRAAIADCYTRRLGGHSDLACPTIPDDVEMSWGGYLVRLSDQFDRDARDEIIRGLHRHDIGAADHYCPVPHLPPIAERVAELHPCPVAESVSQRTLALPFFTALTGASVEYVCQTLELMLDRGTFSRGELS